MRLRFDAGDENGDHVRKSPDNSDGASYPDKTMTDIGAGSQPYQPAAA
jgi:hypothetical protein